MCINCFSLKHQDKECPSINSCRTCGSRHHTSMHQGGTTSNALVTTPSTVTDVHCKTTMLHSSSNDIYTFVFLKTAIFYVKSQGGDVKVNSLFDEGAQRSWITRNLAKKLGLRIKSKDLLKISGFANAPIAPAYYDIVEVVIIEINVQTSVFRAVVIDQLVNPLDDEHRKTLQDLPLLKDLTLAHPFIGQDTYHVDLLIGADYYWHFVGDEPPIRGQGPTAVKSKLGYFVSGPFENTRVSKPTQSINVQIQTVDSADLSFL